MFRNGKRFSVLVTLSRLDEDIVSSENAAQSTSADIGLSVRPLTPELAEQSGFDRSQKGLIVTDVEPGRLADRAGLRPGQLIVSIHGKPVTDVKSFRDSFTEKSLKKGIRLQILSNGMRRFLFLRTR